MKLDLSSLNLLDKWIVEHGAAAVMGSHIELLRDQLSALDREATNLKSKVAELEATNKDLTEKCQHRAARIHELEVAQAKANEEKKGADVTDEQLKILRFLAQRCDSPITADGLARAVGLTIQRIRHNLDVLTDGEPKLVSRNMYMGAPSTYVWNKNTRAFLNARGEL